MYMYYIMIYDGSFISGHANFSNLLLPLLHHLNSSAYDFVDITGCRVVVMQWVAVTCLHTLLMILLGVVLSHPLRPATSPACVRSLFVDLAKKGLELI